MALGAWYLRSGRTAAQIDSLAVLPFTNGGGDANTDYLSDGITESLIDNLAHVPQLSVKSRNSVFRYKGKDVDVQKVGNELGVSALVIVNIGAIVIATVFSILPALKAAMLHPVRALRYE